MAQETKFFPLRGGLNIATPAIEIPPGQCIDALNYECVQKGYQRIDGYERYDGHPAPSAAGYWVLNFVTGSIAVTAGQTVTGGTSGATGVSLIAGVLSSGTYAGSTAAGYLVLTAISGTFVTGESLKVSGATVCVASGSAIQSNATTTANDTAWSQAATAYASTLIGQVPGSGNILGCWTFNGNTYAFRNNALGTAALMYKASSTGWTLVPLGYSLPYAGGVVQINVGDVITGATSGATGTVTQVTLQTGTWGSTALGQIIFASTTGTFQNGETLKVSGTTKATASAASAAITLLPNGKYEFDNYNFYGGTSTQAMYGCDGVNRAFEFNGSVFVPLITGMVTDAPKHICAWQNQLFLSFPGGSLQNSSIGYPYGWSAVTGASEIGIGEEITALINTVVNLVVGGRSSVNMLYGNTSANFSLSLMNGGAGMIEWTAQQLNQPMYGDDRGLRNLNTTQTFGDFEIGTVTTLIQPLWAAKKKAGIYPVNSIRVRAKDQYRVFFSDGSGITVYIGRGAQSALTILGAVTAPGAPECMPFNLGKVVTCCCSSEDANGNEIMFFGSTDGYLYQLDSGTSFDQQPITAYMRLAFNNVGGPTQNKRWHKVTLECDATASSTLGLIAEYAYSDPDLSPSTEQDFLVQGGGGYWDESNWDQFYWSATFEGLAECHVDGIGRNISVGVISVATYEQPHILHGLILHFSQRGLVR